MGIGLIRKQEGDMQLRTSPTIRFFDSIFRNKYRFEEYTDSNRPALFFGAYSQGDRDAIVQHTGKKIVWFAGADATMFTDPSFLKDAIVIAESKWIQHDLDVRGIKYESISLIMDDVYNWHPAPLGKSLYWYGGRNSRYGKRYLNDVRKAFPDLDIIIHDKDTVPRNEMPSVYERCFAGIRPVEHDGMSQSVAELALMGRMSVWNMETPFSVPFQGSTGLIEAIAELRKGYNWKLTAKRARGWLLRNERAFTSLVLQAMGVEEMDFLKIFEDARGRCGSIFRIQRTEDIRKIDGFGDKQFERPDFDKKMKELGKKLLITSKNSGYIATEFKNVGRRKGYPEGVNFRTHDRGTR